MKFSIVIHVSGQSQNIVFRLFFGESAKKRKPGLNKLQNHLLTVKDLPLDKLQR